MKIPKLSEKFFPVSLEKYKNLEFSRKHRIGTPKIDKS